MAFLGSIMATNAQRTVVRAYPEHGTVVTTITKPRVIVHNKTKFYFANGVWYKARNKKYVVCPAPIGIKVRTLPKEHEIVRVKV